MSLISGESFGLAVLIYIAMKTSSQFRYFLKMLIFVVTCFLVTVLPIPLMLLHPGDYKNALIPAYGCRKIAKFLGVTFQVRGAEHINRNRGAVVIINHQSIIDLVVLAELWPIIGRATVVSKKEIFYLQPFGLACYLWGTLFIDRQDRKSAKQKINKESKAINEKQSKLLFFPEGTRGWGDSLLPFKKGPFIVAVDSQCSIQPIVVSRYNFLNSNGKSFENGQNIIKILPEISTEGLNRDDIVDLIDKTQKLMQTEYEKLSDESLALNDGSE